MVQRQKVTDTFTDEEFGAAMEKALKEDKALLERLAKV